MDTIQLRFSKLALLLDFSLLLPLLMLSSNEALKKVFILKKFKIDNWSEQYNTQNPFTYSHQMLAFGPISPFLLSPFLLLLNGVTCSFLWPTYALVWTAWPLTPARSGMCLLRTRAFSHITTAELPNLETGQHYNIIYNRMQLIFNFSEYPQTVLKFTAILLPGPSMV